MLGATFPEGRTVRANGLEIYYREWGSGRPLILLHGATDTSAFWLPFIEEFSERFRVLALDTRGHGRTINPGSTLTYQLLADDLAGFIQALELDSPLIFGYSDGGQTALDFGIRYPERVGALVIGGVWHKFSHSYQQAITREGFLGPGEVDFPALSDKNPPDWEERFKRVHLDPREDYPRILLSQLSRLWWTPLDYTDEDFMNMAFPTLVIMGEKDEMIPLEEARELALKIPRAELAVIPGAGHTEVIVSGGDFLDVVIDFLNRLGP